MAKKKDINDSVDKSSMAFRVGFYGLFIALIVLSYFVVEPFISVIILSVITVIMLKPVYNYILKRGFVKGKKRRAAVITLTVFLLLLVIPVFFLLWLLIDNIAVALEQFASLDLEKLVQELEANLQQYVGQVDLSSVEANLGETLQAMAKFFASALGDVAVSLGSSLMNLIIMGFVFVVLVVTLMPIFDDLLEKTTQLSPLGAQISDWYNKKIVAMVSSLALGVFLIAIIQGLIMGVFYWLAGMSNVFFWMVLSMVFAMLPVVGISFIVIGVAIFFVLTGNVTSAVIVLFGFYGIVNWIDIWLRPKFISKEARMNYALVLIGIFGGIYWAGFMGLFYGPVILLLLKTTVEIYVELFGAEDKKTVNTVITTRSKKDN